MELTPIKERIIEFYRAQKRTYDRLEAKQRQVPLASTRDELLEVRGEVRAIRKVINFLEKAQASSTLPEIN
jgi:hypothetical protein